MKVFKDKLLKNGVGRSPFKVFKHKLLKKMAQVTS